MNHLAGGAEGLAGAQFFEDVVHLGHGQVGMRFLAAFAVGVELFAEESDAFALGFGGVGKGEGLEAAGLDVAGIVSETEPTARRERPRDVNAAGEDSEHVRVAGGDIDEHIVRQDGCVQENKEAVLCGFDGCDVATEAIQGRAEVGARLTENPPIVAVRLPIVLIAFGLHVIDTC